MKTRDQIYHREGEKLLRFLTTYHALKYEQVMKMFGNQDSIKSLITSLVKQGRIYHDKEAGLLCDSPEAAKSPDRGTIAAFWVLLDFEKPIVFHTRALKNIVFVNFIFNNKKSTSLKSSFGGFSKFCLNGLYAKSDYFLSINFMILLRFTANIAIAPCISMPIRPDDDATS